MTTRRHLIAAGAAFGLPALAGCGTWGRPAPDPAHVPMQGLAARAAQVPTPESPNLRERLQGTLTVAQPEVLTLDLRTGERRLRGPGVLASEADARGRQVVLRVDDAQGRAPAAGEWLLEMVDAQGRVRTLQRSPGSLRGPLREPTLSFDGQLLAYVGAPAAGPSGWHGGTVMVMSTADTAPRPMPLPLQALSDVLVPHTVSWFPDNRHVAAVVQGREGQRRGQPQPGREEPDPQIVVIDVVRTLRHLREVGAELGAEGGADVGGSAPASVQAMGLAVPIGPGRQVWVSTDGRSVLTRQIRPLDTRLRAAMPQAPVGDLLLLDPNGGLPRSLPRVPQGPVSVVGWLQGRYLVYRTPAGAEPAPGSAPFSAFSSAPARPRSEPKGALAVKVMDTETGEHLTLLAGLDPRTPVAVR